MVSFREPEAQVLRDVAHWPFTGVGAGGCCGGGGVVGGWVGGGGVGGVTDVFGSDFGGLVEIYL